MNMKRKMSFIIIAFTLLVPALRSGLFAQSSDDARLIDVRRQQKNLNEVRAAFALTRMGSDIFYFTFIDFNCKWNKRNEMKRQDFQEGGGSYEEFQFLRICKSFFRTVFSQSAICCRAGHYSNSGCGKRSLRLLLPTRTTPLTCLVSRWTLMRYVWM